MQHYQRHIGDYAKKAGRLSILQHGVYNLLMDACYDRESFPTRDEAIDWVWAASKEEIEAVDFVLRRFFTLQDDGKYVQNRIREELEIFAEKCQKQAEKGRKGGRPKKTHGVKLESQKKPVALFKNPDESQRVLKKTLPSTHYPVPSTQEEKKPLALSPNSDAASKSPPVIALPTNRFNSIGEFFEVTEDMLPAWEEAYPAVNVRQELLKINAWLQDNPAQRKTAGGMRRFLGSWFGRTQNRGGSQSPNQPIRRPSL